MPTLGDLASFVTSKNAGPHLLTLDVVFPDAATYRRVVKLRLIDRGLVAALYRLDAADVLDVIEFDPAYAIKVTLRRPLASGAVGETDVYGAQQHVPLMELEVPWEVAVPRA